MTDLYPSRCSEATGVLPRVDPVAWQPWRHDCPLSREQYEAWCRDGFLVLEGLFDEFEVRVLQRELERLRASPELVGRPECIAERGSRALRSLFAPHRHSRLYAQLMRDERLLGIAEFLLASPVYVHQARVNFKPGLGGDGFYWHSDFETWHTEDGLPRMRTLSVSVSLTENTPLNGPLMLIPGSHLEYVQCAGSTPEEHYRRSLQRQEAGLPDAEHIARMAAHGICTATGRPGTVTLFDCNTLHGSAGNLSPWPRSNVFFVYNSIENRPAAPFAAEAPRPWYIGEREDFAPLQAMRPDYRRFAEEAEVV
ncbi:MAG: ectoine hydroxylase [Zoogloeaceae bacterium]|nr:ectoine hydroxylase [Zoogloeaceae bacterium]